MLEGEVKFLFIPFLSIQIQLNRSGPIDFSFLIPKLN